MTTAASPPSAWQIERVMSAVQQALAALQPPEPINGETDTDEAHAEGMMDWLVNHGGANGGIDLPLVMERLLLAADEAGASADNVDRRIEWLRTRKARFERREKAWREAALGIMTALPELFPKRSFKCDWISASVRTGKPGVIVTDVDKLEDRFVRVKREADKVAIATAFADGEIIEGAEQSNARDFLTIRRN